MMTVSSFSEVMTSDECKVPNWVIHLSWDFSGPRGLVQKNLYLLAVMFSLDVKCLFTIVRAAS